MKNNFLKSIGIVCAALLSLSSCEMLSKSFTKSLGENFKRDKSEVFADASVSELADMASNPESANADTAKALMDALSENPKAVLELDAEKKKGILDLALGATIPMSTITDVLGTVDIANIENLTEDKEKLTDLVDTVLGSMNSFDTTAINALLTDKETLTTVDPSTLANAAIASIAQIATTSETMKGKLDTLIAGDTTPGTTVPAIDVDFKEDAPADIVKELLGEAPTQESGQTDTEYKKIKDDHAKTQKDLAAAVSVVQLLMNNTTKVPIDTNGDGIIQDNEKEMEEVKLPDSIKLDDIKILGVMSLGDLFGGADKTKTDAPNPVVN